MFADAGAQVVDAQIDGAQFAEAVQALLGGFVHVARADGRHHCQATHRVQPGADHAAVNTVVGVVAHQLVPHVDAGRYPLGHDGGDLEAQRFVEDDAFFKNAFQALQEFRFELGR